MREIEEGDGFAPVEGVTQPAFGTVEPIVEAAAQGDQLAQGGRPAVIGRAALAKVVAFGERDEGLNFLGVDAAGLRTAVEFEGRQLGEVEADVDGHSSASEDRDSIIF